MNSSGAIASPKLDRLLFSDVLFRVESSDSGYFNDGLNQNLFFEKVDVLLLLLHLDT